VAISMFRIFLDNYCVSVTGKRLGLTQLLVPLCESLIIRRQTQSYEDHGRRKRTRPSQAGLKGTGMHL
jgi:hypothetical protein